MPLSEFRARSATDRANAIVETALVLPVLVVLLVAIIEGGTLLYARLTVEHAVRAAARAVSVAADAVDGDARALDMLRSRVGGLDPDAIERIVFYRAASPDAGPPPACAAGPRRSPALDLEDGCLVVTPSEPGACGGSGSSGGSRDLATECEEITPAGGNGSGGSGWTLVCGWCAADRSEGELIGVWLSYRRTSITGAFPALSLTEHRVAVVEAGAP